MVQGDQGVRRARYEARWHAFAAKDTPAAASEVAYGQVHCRPQLDAFLTSCLSSPQWACCLETHECSAEC